MQEDIGRLPPSNQLTPADVKEQIRGQLLEILIEDKRPAAGPNPDPGPSQSWCQRQPLAGHLLSTDNATSATSANNS